MNLQLGRPKLFAVEIRDGVKFCVVSTTAEAAIEAFHEGYAALHPGILKPAIHAVRLVSSEAVITDNRLLAKSEPGVCKGCGHTLNKHCK